MPVTSDVSMMRFCCSKANNYASNLGITRHTKAESLKQIDKSKKCILIASPLALFSIFASVNNKKQT